LLNKRETIRLMELISEKCETPKLAVGLGVFLTPPRLYDPEAEGWRILIDQRLTKIEAQRIEDLINRIGLRCSIYLHHDPFIEIFRPRAAYAVSHP
jgi:hypothetical protein